MTRLVDNAYQNRQSSVGELEQQIHDFNSLRQQYVESLRDFLNLPLETQAILADIPSRHSKPAGMVILTPILPNSPMSASPRASTPITKLGLQSPRNNANSTALSQVFSPVKHGFTLLPLPVTTNITSNFVAQAAPTYESMIGPPLTATHNVFF